MTAAEHNAAIALRQATSKARRQGIVDVLDLLVDGATDPRHVGNRAMMLALVYEVPGLGLDKQAELARRLGVSRQAVSRGVDTLIAELSVKQGDYETTG